VPYVAQASSGWQDALLGAAAGRPIVAVADCVSGGLLAGLAPLIANNAAIITYGGLDPNPIGLTGLAVASRQLEVRGITGFPWLSAPREVQL